MAVQIRHTKQQIEYYHSKIKQITLFPLEKLLIDNIAKAPPHQSHWQHAIDISFENAKYNENLDESSDSLASSYINDLSEWQQKKINTQFKQLFNIDIIPLLNEKETSDELNLIITDNIKLIKSIPSQLHDQVNQQFDTILYQDGFNQQKILNMFTQRFAVSNSRSKLISRDQTAKTIGGLAGIRQKQAGVTKFIWRTSEDEAVRPDHQALDKQIFSWSNPPPIGIPGQPINCRCVAIPFIN